MKKANFLLLLLVGFLFTNHIKAQKAIHEATINYKISIEASDEKTALAKSLEGATLTVYLKGTQSRTDMTSALGTESNLYDNKSRKGIILKQYSGQKLMITLTAENWAQKNQLYKNIKFNIDDAPEQTIAGYKCRKATGTSADGKTYTIYFTADILPANRQYESAFAQLPGLPVQYELQSGELKFKYTLSTISYEPVPANKFEIPKSGYRVMTYAETQQLKEGNK